MAFSTDRVEGLLTRIKDGEFLFAGAFTQDENETWRNVKFVNAYEITQGYGGPEEGGWWYDIRTPLASIPVDSISEACTAIAKLVDRYGEDFANRREYYSAAGGEDLNICVDNRSAYQQPEERPHYE